jgi:hypothetical protein
MRYSYAGANKELVWLAGDSEGLNRILSRRGTDWSSGVDSHAVARVAIFEFPAFWVKPGRMNACSCRCRLQDGKTLREPSSGQAQGFAAYKVGCGMKDLILFQQPFDVVKW